MMASPTAPPPAQGGRLNVIALISGGKDSFFSLLHCLAHGHRVVALANLHPPETNEHEEAQQEEGGGAAEEEEEEDLNSFMYQTVGHQVIPLYAEATGIPLYRQPILGGATQGKDYSHFSTAVVSTEPQSESAAVQVEGDNNAKAKWVKDDDDETESMIPLLLAIKRAHPEANAICAGAILSTYQRTRVESVAVRLGLTPLAFLWKFPILPVPQHLAGGDVATTDAQLLDDMAAAGMEARIIKVASGGLDDSFLWTNVADRLGKERIARSMRRFGTASEKGAVIGEGGEFETLVLDGPRQLFRKRIMVEEKDRRVIREGGGCAWLSFRSAKLEDKEATVAASDEDKSEVGEIRIPDLLDARFVGVSEGLNKSASASAGGEEEARKLLALLSLDPQHSLSKQEGTFQLGLPQSLNDSKLQQWCFFGNASSSAGSSSTVETETSSLVSQIRQRLQQFNLPPSAILTSTILLRHMADFPAVNAIYGALFDSPNPPSRVCVACGDSLSAFTNNNGSISIAIYLTVHTGFTNKSKTDQRRQGLHVQSRSYWAPANIGPYSQAISIPLASLSSSSKPPNSTGGNHDDGNGGPKLVTIAGQIPLVPATMALPPAESEQQRQALNTQLALSLQHLWRIGLEVGVQWWTSAVAYFPAATTDSSFSMMPMSEKARLAYKTWQSAHEWSSKVASADEDSDGNSSYSDDDDKEDFNGPDLWDRKFNPRYMSFAVTSTDESSSEPKLPDWSVLSRENSKNKKKRTIPLFFAAQVAELPRSAGVEWHAHLGIAKAGPKCVTVLESFQANVSGDGTGEERVVEVHRAVVRSPAPTSDQDDDDDMDHDDDDKGIKNEASGRRPALLQTIMVERHMGGSSPLSSSLSSSSSWFTAVDELAWLSTRRLINQGRVEPENERGGPSVMVRYVDVGLSATAAALDGGSGGGGGGVPVAVVPCASLWDADGERLASVTIYQSVFE